MSTQATPAVDVKAVDPAPDAPLERPAAPDSGRDAMRAALLSEAEWEGDAVADEAPSPDLPVPEPEAEAVPEGEAEPTPEPEEAAAESEAEPAAAPESETDTDPELERRLAAIQKEEARAKEFSSGAMREVREAREALEREQREWKAKLDSLESLKERARYDVVGMLEELGATADDFEPLAKQLYAHSKAAADNPALRESAARARRERERGGELSQMRREMQELRQELKTRDERETNERAARQYMGEVEKSVTDDAPIVRNLLKNNPEGTRELLMQTAVRLGRETGERPEPLDVLRAVERERRGWMEAAGIDLSALGRVKKQTQVAGENDAATTPTLSPSELGKPATPREEPKSREELKEQVLREITTGKYVT